MPEFFDPNSPVPVKRKENTLDRLERSGKFAVTLLIFQKGRVRTRTFGPFSSYSAAARVRNLMAKRIKEDNEWSDTVKSVHVNQIWTDPKHEV